MEPESGDDQPKRRLIRANISLRLSTSFDEETQGLSEVQSEGTLDDPFSEEQPEGEEDDEQEKDDLLNENVPDDSLMEQGIMNKTNMEYDYEYEDDDDDNDDNKCHQIDSHKDNFEPKTVTRAEASTVKFSDRLCK